VTVPTLLPARIAPVPVPPSTAPAPRALVDYDFQSILAAPPKQRLILWLMVGLVVVAVIGLAIAKVDIVVGANGRMVTSDSEIVVQPFETSVVRSVAVRMGQKVKAGEVLATLDPTFTQADESELVARLSNLQATYDRLEAELAGRPYDPADPRAEERTQRDIFRKRHDEYIARVTALERKTEEYEADLAAHKTEAEGLAEEIRLTGEAEAMYRGLVAKSLASKIKLIEVSEQLIEAKSRLDTNRGEQQKLSDEISGTLAERDAFIYEWKRKLAEEMAQTRSDRDAASARLSKARRRHEMSAMTSPRDAIVLDVAKRPAGSVMREAETLMRLVPTDAPLLAEVEVDTRDVGRLRLGNPVTLKFEALPWQQFGLAYGKLKTLTPDTLADESDQATADTLSSPELRTELRHSPIHYRARIEIVKTKFRNLPDGFELRPGMRLVADIKVGRRTLLDYVLNPVTRVIDESLREP
jgi:hemolysin D